MSKVNGFRVQGVDGDVDKVSVQSSAQASHLLTRRRWRFMPARWTDLELQRDEQMVLKCNDGQAIVRVKSLGGPWGALCINNGGKMVHRLKDGQVALVMLEKDQGCFLSTASQTFPIGNPGASQTVAEMPR